MIFRLAVTSLILAYASAAVASLPAMTGNTSRPECVDAMALAKAMFESTAERVYAPLNIPDGMQSKLILGTSQLDISGGDALQSSDDFEKVPRKNAYHRSIYWENKADGARRIIVVETPLGWRGDMYSLYLLDQDIQLSSFLSSLETSQHDASYTPLVSDAWRPPLVFRLSENGTKWFIDVGQPYQIFADWAIYTAAANQPICMIAFQPSLHDASRLLPRAVQSLARKLNEALGPGDEEGTLQATTRQRLHAQHVLANAALRPWALSDSDAYNSRWEVDAGLEDWARAAHTRLRLYKDMLRIYPEAERSLAAYYTRVFGIPSQKANEEATWVLDLIYRSYFIFSNGCDYFRYDGNKLNPWPDKVRESR